MATGKPIQLILARQLAESVAMPILLVDTEGTLVFYNEPAEAIMRRRFEETGEIRADEWNAIVRVVGEDRQPLPPGDRPLRAALVERKPVSRTIWTQNAANEWQHLHVTAVPLVGEAERLLGAMLFFWEV